MFSGGNWQQPTYGVGFAGSSVIAGETEWEQFCDGTRRLPILRTIPETVIGPGHNSVILGPNGRELFCVYHSWVNDERVLSIDRMDFAGNRVFVLGPTVTPQPAPYEPSLTLPSIEKWEVVGNWELGTGSMRSSRSGAGSLTAVSGEESFLCSYWFTLIESSDVSEFGFRLVDGDKIVFEAVFYRAKKELSLSWIGEDGAAGRGSKVLGDEFNFDGVHEIRVEVDGPYLKFNLDGPFYSMFTGLSARSARASLFESEAVVEFAGFGSTAGFEDLFDRPDAEPSKYGWKTLPADTSLAIADKRLAVGENGSDTVIYKGKPSESFEFVANVRLPNLAGDGGFGFVFFDAAMKSVFEISFIGQKSGNFAIFTTGGTIETVETGEAAGAEGTIAANNADGDIATTLPAEFAGDEFHQFRLTKIGGEITAVMENFSLGRFATDAGPALQPCRRSARRSSLIWSV